MKVVNKVAAIDPVASFEKVLTNKSAKDVTIYPGFSDRLNDLIDRTPFDVPAKGQGRYSWIANVVGTSRPTGTAWLEKNKVPNDATFHALVVFLLNHIEGKHNIARIKSWLLYGEEVVPNPFLKKKSSSTSGLAAKLIVETAESLNINNSSYDFSKVLDDTVMLFEELKINEQSKLSQVHMKFIADYLKLHSIK